VGAQSRIARRIPIDEAIATVAHRQHGNVTQAQLLALGLSRNAIWHRAKAGRLYRVHSCVYAVGRPPKSPLERAAAAVLACGPGAALSYASAMTLWGFWKRWDTPLEVSVRKDRRPKGITVHRPRNLILPDLTTHYGIRTTTPARTLWDIAPRLDDPALRRAVKDGLFAKYLPQSQLLELLERHPDHPATTRLIAFMGGGLTRAEWEDDFPSACAHYGLPQPVMSAQVGPYTVDALFVREMLIVELDGWPAHRTAISFESDRDRDADTASWGFGTVRITWTRIHAEADREFARLNATLEVRRAQLDLNA
jgi:Protein of unknown function (DUF559)